MCVLTEIELVLIIAGGMSCAGYTEVRAESELIKPRKKGPQRLGLSHFLYLRTARGRRAGWPYRFLLFPPHFTFNAAP